MDTKRSVTALLGLYALVHPALADVVAPSTRWIFAAHFDDDNKYSTTHYILSEFHVYTDSTCSPASSARDSVNGSYYDCVGGNKAPADGAAAQADDLEVLWTQDTISVVPCNVSASEETVAACDQAYDGHYLGFTFKQELSPQCVKVRQATCAQILTKKFCVLGWDPEAVDGLGGWRHRGWLSIPDQPNENVIVEAVMLEDQECLKNPTLKDKKLQTETAGGKKKEGLSETELAIVIVVVLFAGSTCGCLFMWYWRKKLSKKPATNDVEMVTRD